MKNKKLILVVDDNPVNIQVLSNILSNNGYNPAATQDGEGCLDFVKYKIPDLILLDVMMPGIDGFEVCKLLKNKNSTKNIPIIFLSAKNDSEAIVRGFDVGGVDYITKPFNKKELLARIKTHLELKVLKGLIPICAKCKKIKNDKNYWESIEKYLSDHSDMEFTHGLCPDCMDELYGDKEWYIKKIKNKRDNEKDKK